MIRLSERKEISVMLPIELEMTLSGHIHALDKHYNLITKEAFRVIILIYGSSTRHIG